MNTTTSPPETIAEQLSVEGAPAVVNDGDPVGVVDAPLFQVG